MQVTRQQKIYLLQCVTESQLESCRS